MLLALQTAIRAVLLGDGDLAALVSGVYDHVPEGAEFPYVVLGRDITSSPDNTHATLGRRTIVPVHVWSTYAGSAEVVEILDRIQTLLDHQALTVPGQRVTSVLHETTQVLDDPDPDIRHGVADFAVTHWPG